MKSFFNHRRTRYTAAVMLFVWLLALGTGIANACLVQKNHGPHGDPSHSHSVFTSTTAVKSDVTSDILVKTTAHDDADEHEMSPEKAVCLNFCVAEQNTLVKHHADGLADVDIVPVLFLTWLLVPAVDQASKPEAFGSPTWSEPPVSIRYLRLTI